MKNSVYTGILITLAGYLAGLFLSKKFKNPIANPTLIGSAFAIICLNIFDISFEEYNIGGSVIMFFIAPATVSLVIPLYKNIDILKKNLIPILSGIIAGSFVAVFSVLILSKAFKLDKTLIASLLPQSITTAIAIPLSDAHGGISSLTSVFVAFRGIFGAIVSSIVFKMLKIDDSVAIGVSLGTSSHAIGTGKAIELGEIEGAMSGLSIAIAGILTVFIVPLAFFFL